MMGASKRTLEQRTADHVDELQKTLDRLERWCRETPQVKSAEVAEALRVAGLVVHGGDDAIEGRPILASKFIILDTTRTISHPDGHFLHLYVLARPAGDERAERWIFEMSERTEDLG